MIKVFKTTRIPLIICRLIVGLIFISEGIQKFLYPDTSNSRRFIFGKYHISIPFWKKEKSFTMKLGWFIPVGFFVEFFSTLIGAVGPVLNPFYLNYGLEKEKMISTKTMNSFLIGLVQVSSYTALGSLKGNLWTFGLALGLGASVGNWIGKTFLKKLTNEAFRKWVIVIMVVSGILMIIKQAGKF